MNPLKNLFLEELACRYDAEGRIVRAMPKFKRAATCSDLRNWINCHFQETEDHLRSLEQVFKLFVARVRAKKCKPTMALLKSGDAAAAAFKDSPAINAALISSAQKIQHCEIASYGCLREWAALMGNLEAAFCLQAMLDQEKAANQALIKLARARSNYEAFSPMPAPDRGKAGDAKPLNKWPEPPPVNFGRDRRPLLFSS